MSELQRRLQELSGTRLDAVGAANVWAGTTGLDLLGALNVKAGTDGLGLNAVVRRLTGGTGEADAELSRPAPWNLALRKKVTISAGGVNPERVTDGVVSTDAFATASTDLQHCVVDLGETHLLSSVVVRHYFGDGRTYHQTKTEVSADGTTWQSLFDSANPLTAIAFTDPSYEGGSVPAGAAGYASVTPSIMAGGYNSANSLGVTTNSTTNVQGMYHMASVGQSVAAGTRVRGSVWVKAPVNTELRINGRAQEVSTTATLAEGGGNVFFTATGDWQFVQTNEWTYLTKAFRPGIQVLLKTAASGVEIRLDQAATGRRTQYAETEGGRTYAFAQRPVRYIRDWIAGNSANTGNHWVEIEAYA